MPFGHARFLVTDCERLDCPRLPPRVEIYEAVGANGVPQLGRVDRLFNQIAVVRSLQWRWRESACVRRTWCRTFDARYAMSPEEHRYGQHTVDDERSRCGRRRPNDRGQTRPGNRATVPTGCLFAFAGVDPAIWMFSRWPNASPSALDQHFIYRVVLELEESVLPCEQLIEELRLLEEWIEDHHGVLRLCGLPARYTKSFLRSQVTQRFPLYQDREEAVWGGPRFCPPR